MRGGCRLIAMGAPILCAVFAWSGVSDTCVLEGGNTAYYECPKGFDLLLTGQQTPHCDGRCVEPKKDSVKIAVKTALVSRSLTLPDSKIEKITNELIQSGKATVEGTTMVLKRGEQQ